MDERTIAAWVFGVFRKFSLLVFIQWKARMNALRDSGRHSILWYSANRFRIVFCCHFIRCDFDANAFEGLEGVYGCWGFDIAAHIRFSQADRVCGPVQVQFDEQWCKYNDPMHYGRRWCDAEIRYNTWCNWFEYDRNANGNIDAVNECAQQWRSVRL